MTPAQVKQEAHACLNFLASMPRGTTTATRAVVREILTTTSGKMLAQGAMFDIMTKHLGAGIYQIRLEAK